MSTNVRWRSKIINLLKKEGYARYGEEQGFFQKKISEKFWISFHISERVLANQRMIDSSVYLSFPDINKFSIENFSYEIDIGNAQIYWKLDAFSEQGNEEYFANYIEDFISKIKFFEEMDEYKELLRMCLEFYELKYEKGFSMSRYLDLIVCFAFFKRFDLCLNLIEEMKAKNYQAKMLVELGENVLNWISKTGYRR